MCHECDTFIQDTKAIHAIDNTNIQLKVCSVTCSKGYNQIKQLNCIICNKIMKNSSTKRAAISCKQCCMPVHDKCLSLSLNIPRVLPEHGNEWRCFECLDVSTCNNFVDVAGVHNDIVKKPAQGSSHGSSVNIGNNKYCFKNTPPTNNFYENSIVNITNTIETDSDNYVDVVDIDEFDTTHIRKCNVQTKTKNVAHSQK